MRSLRSFGSVWNVAILRSRSSCVPGVVWGFKLTSESHNTPRRFNNESSLTTRRAPSTTRRPPPYAARLVPLSASGVGRRLIGLGSSASARRSAGPPSIDRNGQWFHDGRGCVGGETGIQLAIARAGRRAVLVSRSQTVGRRDGGLRGLTGRMTQGQGTCADW